MTMSAPGFGSKLGELTTAVFVTDALFIGCDYHPSFQQIAIVGSLQFELWTVDPAQIRSKWVRKQKTDRRDAQLILQLLMGNRFPRIWVTDAANRDLRNCCDIDTDWCADAHPGHESVACGYAQRRTCDARKPCGELPVARS